MAEHRPSLTPVVCYRDPKAALPWLEKAFGFELYMLIEDPSSHPLHAEMRYGDCLLMVGSEWTADHRSPIALGGKNTGAVHIPTGRRRRRPLRTGPGRGRGDRAGAGDPALWRPHLRLSGPGRPYLVGGPDGEGDEPPGS